jgi:glycosyltransferase involved in cell wall biosynthesis
LILTSWGDEARPTKIRHALRFAKLLIQFRPQVVLSVFGAVNISSIVSKLVSFGTIKTIAYYQTLVTQIQEDEGTPFFKWLRKSLVYKIFCSKIVTHTRLSSADFRGTYGDHHIEIVPSALPDRVGEWDGVKNRDQAVIKIGYLGRLSPSKGLRELVSAVKILKSHRPDTKIRVYIAGGGVLEGELRNSGSDLITVLGPLKYEKVDGFFREMDFSIVPSHSDAFALVVPEAMMNFTPPLVSRMVGASEFLNDGIDSFHFDPNPESIAECLMEAEDSIDCLQEMRKAARETYLQEFTVDRYIRDMRRVLFEG